MAKSSLRINPCLPAGRLRKLPDFFGWEGGEGLTGLRIYFSLLLNLFWATWCTSCKEEIPLLEKFYVAKKDQLAILLITIDGERKKAAQKIADQNKVTVPVLLLLKEKVMDQYGVRGWVPQTFLIDQEGMLAGKIVGQRDWCSPEAWSCLKEFFELR